MSEIPHNLESALEAYPDISIVWRGFSGGIWITEDKSGQTPLTVIVDVDSFYHGERQIGLSAYPGNEMPEFHDSKDSPYTFVDLRPGKTELEASVRYPVNSKLRVDLGRAFSLAKIGLELYDFFLKATPEQRAKAKNIKGGLDEGYIEKEMDEAHHFDRILTLEEQERIGFSLSSRLQEIESYRQRMGAPVLALQVLRRPVRVVAEQVRE
jgi:hypothetical protein